MGFWDLFKRKEKKTGQNFSKTPPLPPKNKGVSKVQDEFIISDDMLDDMVYHWENGEEIINALLKKADHQTEGNVKYVEYMVNLINEKKLEIPTLPDVVMKIIQLSSDNQANINDYVQIIKTDQSIALRIIKLANSMMYRGLRDVNDLNLAISRIGINELKNLVIMLSLQTRILKFTGFKELIEESWRNSLLTAILSAKLARYYSLNPSNAYTIGLTHDIGELIVYNSVRGYESFYRNKYKIDDFFVKRIAKSFHQEISAFVLEDWNFSKEQIDIVSNHHNLPDANTSDYHKLLFISYQTSVILLKFKFEEENIMNFPYDFLIKFSTLPLTEDAFHLLLKDSIKEFKELISIIS